MKNSLHTLLILSTLIALSTACQDDFVPPDDDPVVIDNNKGGPIFTSTEIALGALSGTLIEGGTSATLAVSLEREPEAAVTLTLTSSNEVAGTLAPASMTFTPEDWQTPQTLTITPGDDELASGDTDWAIQFTLESEDASFDMASVPDFPLTTLDNDVAPTLVTEVDGEPIVTEQGGTAVISVQLSRQPKEEVLMQVSVSDAVEASIDVSTLSFDTLTWNLPQQVIVTGLDDMQKDGDAQFVVSFGPANSADEAFNGIGPFGVTLTNVDGVCGNGVVDGAEPCEPGGSTECAPGEQTCMVCNNSCELVETDGTSFCGDNITQTGNGEECDEPEQPCAYGEESCMTCRECKLVPGQLAGFCGDGEVQASAGEACDAPTEACAYGQMSCMTCDNCQMVPGELIGFCGDGMVQADQGEECEGPEEACAYGEMSCTTCRDCQEVAGTVTGFCGDGVLQSNQGEQCDGGQPTNQMLCPRRQLAPCDASCQIDMSSCRNEHLLVTAGWDFGCGVTSTGGVKCWGDNTYGELGQGTMGGFQTSAIVVPGLGSGVKQVDAFSSNACALKHNGEVWCWGEAYGPTPLQLYMAGSGLQKIAVGSFHGCALGLNSQVECWGDDSLAQLGQGAVAGMVFNTVTGLGSDITDISAGSDHTCVTFGAQNQIKCWGYNSNSQLGVSGPDSIRAAQTVSGLSGVEALSLGGTHSCALTSNGLRCWGDGYWGALGTNSAQDSPTPAGIAVLNEGVIAVDAAQYHTCALTNSGQIKCWGGDFGWSAHTVTGLSGGVDQIGGGAIRTCLAMSSGGVRCLTHDNNSPSSASSVSGF